MLQGGSGGINDDSVTALKNFGAILSEPFQGVNKFPAFRGAKRISVVSVSVIRPFLFFESLGQIPDGIEMICMRRAPTFFIERFIQVRYCETLFTENNPDY